MLIKNIISKLPELTLLVDGKGKISMKNFNNNPFIISPICPDYHFREVDGPSDKKERVHDFDGMGDGVGIVYEKLIKSAERLFTVFDKNNIRYRRHLLLVADVESTDKTILKKLNITTQEFERQCVITVNKINKDLKKKGFTKSHCMLMSEFFEKENYDFFKNIKQIKKSILSTNDKALKSFITEVQDKRVQLYKFWFGISEKESKSRAVDDIAMYASFGYCPKVDQGIIFGADSEILSKCYNLKKKIKQPVIYVSGSY